MTAEFVRMMLPYLHHRAPARTVQPRTEPLPEPLRQMVPAGQNTHADMLRAHMMQWLLNYTPDMFDLRGQASVAVTESLVKGRGVMWHEMDRGFCGSFPDSTDNLLLDPDAESLRQCAFAVRVRYRPAWAVAQDFGADAQEIKGAYDSHQNDARAELERAGRPTSGEEGAAGDVVKYYEVYSRMGVGSRFIGVSDELRAVGELLESVGPHVYLAILPGYGILNLPKDRLSEATSYDEIKARLQWPIRCWGDYNDPWPFTCLDFYPHPRRCWPSPPLEPALPLQEFLDYGYSYAIGRLRSTARDLIFTSKSLEPEIREAILRGEDQVVVPFDGTAKDIKELVHILQFPELNSDMYELLAIVERRFREATGLIELAYGSVSRQMRSAEEATVLQQNMSLRPEYLADCVENWHATMASKEAIATRLYVSGDTFARLAGERTPDGSPFPGPLSMAWSQLVSTDDPSEAASQMLYSVESGSGRKKNLLKQASDINEAMGFMFAPAMQLYQGTGDPTLLNGLLLQWGESRQADVSGMLMQDRRAEMQQMMSQQQQPQPTPQA